MQALNQLNALILTQKYNAQLLSIVRILSELPSPVIKCIGLIGFRKCSNVSFCNQKYNPKLHSQKENWKSRQKNFNTLACTSDSAGFEHKQTVLFGGCATALSRFGERLPVLPRPVSQWSYLSTEWQRQQKLRLRLQLRCTIWETIVQLLKSLFLPKINLVLHL